MEGENMIQNIIEEKVRCLDDVLRCVVCRHHLDVATCLVECGHSFCRNCLAGKRRCPQCGVTIFDNALPNRAIIEAVGNFQQVTKISDAIQKCVIPSEYDHCMSEIDIFQEHQIPKPLQNMFQSLACQYCGDLFSKAVCLKPCGHSFCSVCIRRFFQSNKTGIHRQKNQCPTCRSEVGGNVDKQLVINRVVQHAVCSFKAVIKSLYGTGVVHEATTTTRQCRSRSYIQLRSNAWQDADTEAAGTMYSEDCEVPIKKRLPSRNFDKMKLKELKDVCGMYNLSSRGPETELRERLKLFFILWNAELDSICPRTPWEVLGEMQKREAAQKEEEMRSYYDGSANHSDLLKNINAALDHKSGTVDTRVSSGNKSFDDSFQTKFKALVQQAKDRKDYHHRKTIQPSSVKARLSVSEPDDQFVMQKKESSSMIQTNAQGDKRKCESMDCSILAVDRVTSMKKKHKHRPGNDFPTSFEREITTLERSTRESIVDDAKASPDTSTYSLPQRFHGSSTNKENDVSSPLPIFASGCKTNQSHMESLHAAARSSDMATKRNTSETVVQVCKLGTTPVNRPSPIASLGRSSLSASKQIKSPWECTECTYINDGSIIGFCEVCNRSRKRILK